MAIGDASEPVQNKEISESEARRSINVDTSAASTALDVKDTSPMQDISPAPLSSIEVPSGKEEAIPEPPAVSLQARVGDKVDDVDSVYEEAPSRDEQQVLSIRVEPSADPLQLSMLAPGSISQLAFTEFKTISRELYEGVQVVGVEGYGDCGPIGTDSAHHELTFKKKRRNHRQALE
jgi:hypothetical protein